MDWCLMISIPASIAIGMLTGYLSALAERGRERAARLRHHYPSDDEFASWSQRPKGKVQTR